MKATYKVKRYDPERNVTWVQDYTLDVRQSATVLDGLIKIREDFDGTLGLRCSCRASICGSCGMRVNGSAKLVCKTRIEEVALNGEPIAIEPMGNQPVIRDLIVNQSLFFTQMKRVTPFLQPDKEPEQGEFLTSNESMVNLLTAMNCIMCGCCVSDCTVLEVDDNFIGPAALAKAWRFTEDPRDSTRDERLTELNDVDGGIWDCTRCMACVEVCPKEVAPMERIMELRESAIKIGKTNTAGYRHTQSFNSSVRRHGRLDEGRLAVESAGLTNISRLFTDLLPIALRALLKGKLPPLIPHKASNKEQITNIFDEFESRR